MSSSKTDLYKEYNDLKFGMFIHWGAYSTLGGTWKGKQIPHLGEWIMYHAQIPREEYKQVCKNFNPTGFNADEWVKLAKEAGMKYIVAMTKHHEGFSMYHSKVTDFNIYDYTSFKRDPIEEIYKACQKYGIRLGLYYSHSIDWMVDTPVMPNIKKNTSMCLKSVTRLDLTILLNLMCSSKKSKIIPLWNTGHCIYYGNKK